MNWRSIGRTVIENGTEGSSLLKRVGLTWNGNAISAWHDIPLKGKQGFHFVNEIAPGKLQPKMEIDSKDEGRFIVQDKNKKDGTPRYYKHPIASRWNYGALPQTWENPEHNWPGTTLKGDGDPLDVVSLGSPLEIGQVIEVRILGALGLLDQGEVDWKLVACPADDGGYDSFRCVEDLWQRDPKILVEIRDWFRDYKLAEGKSKNEFLYGGTFMNSVYAVDSVLAEAHKQWRIRQNKT